MIGNIHRNIACPQLPRIIFIKYPLKKHKLVYTKTIEMNQVWQSDDLFWSMELKPRRNLQGEW